MLPVCRFCFATCTYVFANFHSRAILDSLIRFIAMLIIFRQRHDSPNWTVNQVCNLSCKNGVKETNVELRLMPEQCSNIRDESLQCNVSQVNCNVGCSYLNPISFVPLDGLYKTIQFWIFVSLTTLGSIGFNVVNSATDTICFNALGMYFSPFFLKQKSLVFYALL